jgi:hypothetical protein
VASLVALAALRRSTGRNVGSGKVLTLSMKRQKRDPKPPNGPTAIGMKAWFELMIPPLTSSGGTVRAVMGLVPPLGRANFILSPSLKRRSISLYLGYI